MSPLSRLRRKAPYIDRTQDPHTWQLPSSYAIAKPGTAPAIPDPSIFADVLIPTDARTSGSGNIPPYPSVGHVAVHLALLECFRELKTRASTLHTATSENREVKVNLDTESHAWDAFMTLAITRFNHWWLNIGNVLTHASAYSRHQSTPGSLQLDENHLPPLDVLFVWYLAMLDPKFYDTLCQTHEQTVPLLHQLCFPWPAILKAIDLKTMHYELSSSAQMLFSTVTKQLPDISASAIDDSLHSEEAKSPLHTGRPSELQSTEDFIHTAHDLLWIRSPALRGSLTRSIVDYFNCELADHAAGVTGKYTSFGIELVKRTHQLFPKQYSMLHSERTGVHQSDSESTLDGDAPNLGLMPKVCSCWTCERVRDELPYFVHDRETHSSSHDQDKPSIQYQLSSLSDAELRQVQDDVGYFMAVEKARQNSQPLPIRPPTAAEKATAKLAKQRQDEAGVLPGIYEYIEVLPDGRHKIRKQKNIVACGNTTFLLAGAMA